MLSTFLIDMIIKDPMGNVLLDYQISKIKNIEKINTAFIGDSSLGNSINSKKFGENTYNFALTGDYNLINSYRMIEKILKFHPELNEVYIMQTLNVFSRDNLDVLNINLDKENILSRIIIKVKSLKYFLTVKPFDKSVINYDSDYMNQTDKIELMVTEISLKKDISNDNKSSILNIKKFCEENNIKYTFLFGPNLPVIKNKYYYDLLRFFKENSINFKKEYYEINKYNVGDATDHVSLDYKNESTEFYKHLFD